ncbi:hypothetical protein DPV78_003958 [Talaromyces pinophilus]|nr:hypothetical protein DPV78_003958 [Talaromyces pinophilus]
MGETARALATQDARAHDFIGQITIKLVASGTSNDYSKFVTQFEEIAASFAERKKKCPGNANLLKPAFMLSALPAAMPS